MTAGPMHLRPRCQAQTPAISWSVARGSITTTSTATKEVKVGLNYFLPRDFTIGAFYSKACDANVLGYGSAEQIGARGDRGAYPRNIGKGVGILLAP
jgi:hypothetical protein